MTTERSGVGDDAGSVVSRFSRRLCAVLFLAALVAGPLLFWLAPARTLATVRAPAWSWTAFRDGSWTAALGRAWRERLPLTVWLRGVHNDLRVRWGARDDPRVHFGRGRWLALAETMSLDEGRYRADGPERRRRLAELAARAAGLGVHLLAAPAPDKVRLYADRLTGDGAVPASRAAHYGDMLDELAAAGIPAVDLATHLQSARARAPERPLYFARDPHWRTEGEFSAMQAVAAEIRRRGWLAPGGTMPFVALASRWQSREGGVTQLLGLLPGGSLAARLTERVPTWDLGRRDAGGARVAVELEAEVGSATVAVCGDSFAQASGPLLSGLLGRVVDFADVVAGGGPLAGVERALQRRADGALQARVLVWVFVERSHAEGAHWRRE